MIPYGRQDITEADINSVIEVLRSDLLTQGPTVPRFEKFITDHCGAKFGIAVNSATSALHIACLALDLGKGDWLWTSPNSFVASANCGLYCGAQVDFVDIDPRTYNMSAAKLEQKLLIAKKQGRLPKIVLPVHFAGQSCEMKEIHKLSLEYGFKIIEDASHAIGGRYEHHPVGDCRYSDITVFSFHPVKIITTAEGGLATTNQPKLAEKMGLLRSHGITRDPTRMSHVPDGPWYYQQIDLGYNFRMTELQGALGLSQGQRLDSYVARRHEIASRYNEELKTLPLTLPWQSPDCYSAFHLYVIRLKSGPESRMTHSLAFNELKKREIAVNLHYIPIHTQPFYERLGFNRGNFPEAELYYSEAISLPMFPTLTESDQTFVISSIKTILTEVAQ